MTPPEVCRDMVEQSGLRGRGGGGFPTGTKWTIAHKQAAEQKYMICNADEGDPGAFMDRAVIEGDPHRVLEGLALAAYAIGASKAYIYTRAEYPLAIRAADGGHRAGQGLRPAGTEHLRLRLLARHRRQAGRRARSSAARRRRCIHSIEGRRGMPRPRPPFPAVERPVRQADGHQQRRDAGQRAGHRRQRAPTWFASIGTASSKGTKVFALSGNVARTGLVEVAMGTTLRQIVFDIGGGIPDGRGLQGRADRRAVGRLHPDVSTSTSTSTTSR